MTRSTSFIDDCINKLKIRGKYKEKRAKTRKKGHGGKHTRPKKWSGARRPAGPATTALIRGDIYHYLSHYVERKHITLSVLCKANIAVVT